LRNDFGKHPDYFFGVVMHDGPVSLNAVSTNSCSLLLE
jgi:hypothetical protein